MHIGIEMQLFNSPLTVANNFVTKINNNRPYSLHFSFYRYIYLNVVLYDVFSDRYAKFYTS